MVLSFIPRDVNASMPPCSGLREYNAGRPPITHAYYLSNLIPLLICLVLMLVASAGIIYYRDHPRFAKVRRPGLSFLALIAINTQMLAIVAVPLGLPCVVPIILFPASISWLIISIVIRCMVITLEYHFAKMAKDLNGVLAEEKDDTGSLAHTQSSVPSLSKWKAEAQTVIMLFHLALGTTKVNALALQQIAMSRRVYAWFALFLAIPAVIVNMIMIIALPQVRNECAYECQEIFLEVPLTLLFLIAFYTFVLVRCMVVAFYSLGWDSKGVMRELFIIPTVVGVPSLVVWILVIVDPGDLAYKHVINWHLLAFPSGMLFWFNSFGLQFYMAWRSNEARRRIIKSKAFVIVNMTKACEADPELKREFREFAARQYCSEMLLFLDDCKAYKQMFFDKPDSWRASKAKLLVKTYIEQGAELEVNISGDCKKRILSRYLVNRTSNDSLFDEAAHEVENLLQQGVWAHFLAKQRKDGLVHPIADASPNPGNTLPRMPLSMLSSSSSRQLQF